MDVLRLKAATCAMLPERTRLFGSITARHLMRSAAVYGVLFFTGLILTMYASDHRWSAFGLGLILPGAGFLAHAGASAAGLLHCLLAVLGLGAFMASLVVWFATGNAFAPPLTWLLAAVLAGSMEHGAVADGALAFVLALVAFASASTLAALFIMRRRGTAWRRKANLYLHETGARLADRFQAVHPREPAEFSAHDLKLLRFVLDRALQPRDAFNGFEWLDQFQTAAVRYQLNFCGYALSMAQSTHLPAFGGYLNDAQRNLIDKQTDHRIWRYWAHENLWGNCAIDANPVGRENIMFTGFCAAQMAMFHAASGCRDYDASGSFTLPHPDGRRFRYDLPALIEALENGSRASAFHLIACEPNWIYPLCNAIGAAAVKARDRQSGSRRWADREALFRRTLEAEFIDMTGRFVPCRSAYTGLALPAIGGAMAQAMPSLFLNATLPDIALRQWLLLRRSLLEGGEGGEGGERLRRGRFWPVDTGNYGFYRAASYAGTALAAVEMGDEDVKMGCLRALQEECPATGHDGVLHRPHASVWAHAVELFARSNTKDGFRRLTEAPRPTTPQPFIASVRYPDVLVASAHHTDGVLRAVLYPGTAGIHPVGLAGLRAGTRYQCDGAQETSIMADAHGCATIQVVLEGRTPILVRPRV